MNEKNLEMVKNILLNSIPNSEVEVTDLTGTYDHLGISVTSSRFEGLTIIKQHQLVMDALKEVLKKEVHAVKIKTKIK